MLHIDFQPAVVDTGSAMCKVGFAGEDAPRSVFPCIVGDNKRGLKDGYVGVEAQINRGRLTVHHPVERGIINRWIDIHKVQIVHGPDILEEELFFVIMHIDILVD